MFENIIEFISTKEYIDQKDTYPEPCKLHIPSWYKEIEHTEDYMTIKGCMPFLDTLTTGYLLKIPVDLHLDHNIYEKQNNEVIRKNKLYSRIPNHINYKLNVNKFHSEENHPIGQVGEKCPFVQKNKNLPFHKILNPWIIKTPPGYSCLFLPPLNNGDDRFSIIPGIVDTDKFISQVNFPIIINGDKYHSLSTLIKKGTPYVQVIPFKREAWKMKIKSFSEKEMDDISFFQPLKMIHNYKTRWWSKKIWK